MKHLCGGQRGLATDSTSSRQQQMSLARSARSVVWQPAVRFLRASCSVQLAGVCFRPLAASDWLVFVHIGGWWRCARAVCMVACQPGAQLSRLVRQPTAVVHHHCCALLPLCITRDLQLVPPWAAGAAAHPARRRAPPQVGPGV
jgi:hypothetical protein